MSDLDRKLAEAAAVAAELKRRKWNTPVPPPGAADVPNAPLTDNKRKILREFMRQEAAASAKAHAKDIRTDVNSILDDFEKDFNKQIKAAGDHIKSAEMIEGELRKLYEELRPKQLVIQQGEVTTELGVIEGAQHYLLNQLIKAVNVRNHRGERKNIILKGPAGSGKSTAGVQVSKAHDLPFYYIGQTLMPHQIEGYVRQGDGVYVETAFVKAFRDGGVLMLEELDAWSPQAVLVANPPLANGYMMLPNGDMIERHEDCIIIGCANTWGLGATAEYVGRNKLDAAFLDRFAFKFDWGYDDQLERAAAQNDDLVTKVQICRVNAQRAGIKVLISPRASIECADMVRCGFTEQEAFELNFLSSLNPDQRRTVLSGVEYD